MRLHRQAILRVLQAVLVGAALAFLALDVDWARQGERLVRQVRAVSSLPERLLHPPQSRVPPSAPRPNEPRTPATIVASDVCE